MSLHIDNDKLLKKCKTVCTNMKDLWNIVFDALPIYDRK